MSKIKGKQIENNSLDLEKIRSGSKLLPNTSTLGTDKLVSEIIDPQEFVTKNYVDGKSSSAGSGLSDSTSGTIELGGNLTKDTTLTGNDKNFDIYSKLSLNNQYGINFLQGFNNTVLDIVYQSDGKLIVGGNFTLYNGLTVPSLLVRLNPDGTLDNTFNSGGIGFDVISQGGIRKLFLQSDDKIIVGGNFTLYNGVSCPERLVRINSNGTLDTTFNNGGSGIGISPFGYVSTISLQPDGKFIIGGFISTYNGVDCPDGLIRINSDGSLDTTFNNGGAGFNTTSAIINAKLQSDGKILCTGVFSTYNGVAISSRLIRINSDGTRDSTFNVGSSFDNFTRPMIIQPDGKIIIGGQFTTYKGANCPDKLVRLNSDATLDTTFNNGGTGFGGTTGSLQSLYLQPDGKILVGGSFSTYNGVDCPDFLVRINSDGTLDTSFNNGGIGFNASVTSINIDSKGKIIVGGSFITFNGTNSVTRIAHLNEDGTLYYPLNRKVILNGYGSLRYENNYHNDFTNRTLVDKEYVDLAISSGSLNGNVWLEQTGFELSGTSGIVSYLGTFTYPTNAATDADIFINGIKLKKNQYYFDTVDNYKPTTTSTLYFNLNNLPYLIEDDDTVEVKYLAYSGIWLPYNFPFAL